DKWTDCGRLGDSTEMNALAVYNGKLYSGSIPYAEVFRYDEGTTWTSIRRFVDVPRDKPAGFKFNNTREGARVTSLQLFGGKIFATRGSYNLPPGDGPADFRGTV